MATPFVAPAANGTAGPVKCGETAGYGVATCTVAESPPPAEAYADIPVMPAETRGVDDSARPL